MVPQRLKLVSLTGIKSSYPIGKPAKLDVSALKAGAQCTDEMALALVSLQSKVNGLGGNLYITDLFRPWDIQARAREDYESGAKKAFVQPPGRSFHQAGRAVDFSIGELNFPGIAKDKQLDKLWELATPLGFKPIIKIPDEGMSECWHFDFMGPWSGVAKNMGYNTAAQCAIIDVGAWDPKESLDKIKRMFCQVQLLRLGFYEIGAPDGIFGSKTRSVLAKMVLDKAPLDVLCDTLKNRN